jgi:hypothetical protein
MLNKFIIFINEMALNTKTKPDYIRCKMPKELAINRRPDNRSRSLIAACTFTKLYAYKVFHNSVNAQKFGSFMLSY